jgi:hypothetical protein
VTYRQFMYVTESEAALADEKPTFYAEMSTLFAGATIDSKMAIGTVGAAMNGAPRNFRPDPTQPPKGPVFSPGLYGTPDNVLKMCAHIKEVLDPGRLEVSIGSINPLPHDLSMKCIKLIGNEIVQVLNSKQFA